MIHSFADNETRALYLTGKSRRWPGVARAAARRLEALDYASALEDLRNTPANPPAKLKGDRAGQWSIGISGQLRVCFRWDGKDAWDVEIVEFEGVPR